MMQSGQTGADAGGPVNWSMVTDVARKTLVQGGGDPSVGDADRRAVVDAVRLADVWLDPAVTFPATTAAPEAWSRSEWLEATAPAWRVIVEPIAEHMQQVVGQSLPGAAGQELDLTALSENLPEQLREHVPRRDPPGDGPDDGPDARHDAAARRGRVQHAARPGARRPRVDVVSSSDIGMPLTEHPVPALLPRNVDAFGEGLGLPVDDVRLYLALRESAHQRLFAHVPWLRPRINGAVEEYARGVHVDQSRLAEAMGDVDMTNPQALQELMGSGLLQPEDTEEQRAAIARLETLLALVEGWVDDVVGPGDRRAPAVRGAAARDDPSSASSRGAGGEDLRDPRRHGASSSTGPRGGHPVRRRACRPRASMPATRSGRTPTCCLARTISRIRWASSRTARPSWSSSVTGRDGRSDASAAPDETADPDDPADAGDPPA